MMHTNWKNVSARCRGIIRMIGTTSKTHRGKVQEKTFNTYQGFLIKAKKIKASLKFGIVDPAKLSF